MNMRTLFTTSLPIILLIIFFFFNDTATTEIYTLSLHDALPISWFALAGQAALLARLGRAHPRRAGEHALSIAPADRKSTRLNSSHSQISYAVFCLKKKKTDGDLEHCASTSCHRLDKRPWPSAHL